MSARVLIGGNGRHTYADLIEGGTSARRRPSGLSVYSSNYEVETYFQTYATDVDGSTLMNIDGTAFAPTVENVHNGTDNAYWTASATAGTWTFNSATQAHSGSFSIDGTATANGSIARLDAAAPIDPADFIQFVGSAYISGSGTGGGTKSLTLQFYNSSNVAVGNAVNLYAYVNINSLNAWQDFAIDLGDFGVLGNDVDRLDLTVINTNGQAVDFYLDDMFISSAGGREFKLIPIEGELTKIYEIEMTLVGAHGATAATAFDLNPNGFGFGAALTEGLVFTRNISGFVSRSVTLMDNKGFAIIPGFKFEPVFADATNGVMKAKFTYSQPLELNPLTGDNISLVVQDDLSGITSLTFGASATVVRKPDLTSI